MEFLFFHIDFPVKLQGTVKDVLKKMNLPVTSY